MAVIVSLITGVGVLIPVLGWAIPTLRAIPSVQPDEERMFGENVRNRMILYTIWRQTNYTISCTGGRSKNYLSSMAVHSW